jgi:A/G-specific adenine glycosylase
VGGAQAPTDTFADALLAWWDHHGRRNLPWQKDPSPYRVWVSEVMLQQTQVATVERYYDRFVSSFPSVTALAEASEDEVLHAWSGLGYYGRARNLQRAARRVCDEHGGEVPRDFAALESLPGIGRSTAGAILALSSNQRHAILDGNVKRVLARVHRIERAPDDPAALRDLWRLAEAHTPASRVDHYTQAIMDLGATLCTRTRPKCDDCPLRESCVARRDGSQARLPARRPKRVRPRRSAFVVVAVNRTGAVLLERRPPSGIWGGLWTFPQFDSELDARAFAGGTADAPLLADYEHAFTHFDLTLRPLLVRRFEWQRATQVADSERYCWYDADRPARIGLAKPVLDIVRQIASQD